MTAEHKSSGYMSMPICWPFLPSDLSAMHKAKPMNSWTHGRMHDTTRIPFSINVGWGKLNLEIHQHVKFYAICSKWFVSKCTATWKCRKRTKTDRWTDRQTNNNIHKHPWMLSVSHLDTSACQIVGHFFQALCMQYTNPSPWMVGRTDERMKWQQYPSASMLAKGKSSGNIWISNSMPFLPSDFVSKCAKTWKCG